MAKKVELPDNLRYLYTKDAASGAQAGFNVQAVRDRLTEIQYDLDHIQGDIDQIINGDLVNIRQELVNINNRIDALTQEFNDFKVEIKNELNKQITQIRNELNAAVAKIEQKIKVINGRLDNLESELAEVKRTYEHFPTGTQMLFYQKSAPPGWSIVTGLDDSIIRVNGVRGGELVNGASFTQVFSYQNVGNTSLSVSQIPPHSHTMMDVGSHTHTISGGSKEKPITKAAMEGVGGAKWNFNGANVLTPYQPAEHLFADWSPASSMRINSAGSHQHSVYSTGGGGTHTHTLDLTIKNISVIVCKKEIVF